MKPTKAALEFLQSIESSWRGHELFAIWLVQKLKPRIIVDLGFDRALSTIAFAMSRRGHIFGIDWFEGIGYSKKSCALDSAFQSISEALACKFVKNIHLIVGPFAEVSKRWDRKIDLLHFDWVHTYTDAKITYEAWLPFLREGGVLLLHDILAYPNETGRFFQEIPFPKLQFTHSSGLGIASKNQTLLKEISDCWKAEQMFG